MRIYGITCHGIWKKLLSIQHGNPDESELSYHVICVMQAASATLSAGRRYLPQARHLN
jgi:hypothetical protein